MEDDLKKNKKWKMTSKNKMKDNLKKNENGKQPQFVLKNQNDDLKKRWKTTSKKNGRRPNKEMEDDLQKKNGRRHQRIF